MTPNINGDGVKMKRVFKPNAKPGSAGWFMGIWRKKMNV